MTRPEVYNFILNGIYVINAEMYNYLDIYVVIT
jgi:hypothetical protein